MLSPGSATGRSIYLLQVDGAKGDWSTRGRIYLTLANIHQTSATENWKINPSTFPSAANNSSPVPGGHAGNALLMSSTE